MTCCVKRMTPLTSVWLPRGVSMVSISAYLSERNREVRFQIWQNGNERSLRSIMSGHERPSLIDSFLSILFPVGSTLPISSFTLTVRAASLSDIHLQHCLDHKVHDMFKKMIFHFNSQFLVTLENSKSLALL